MDHHPSLLPTNFNNPINLCHFVTSPLLLCLSRFGLLGVRQRYGEGNIRAAFRPVANLNRPPLRLTELSHDGQPETTAAGGMASRRL